MRSIRLSMFAISLSVIAVGAAHAQSAKINIVPSGVVADSGPGPHVALFDVFVSFQYVPVECLPSQPNCNVKRVPVCVGFHTVEGTAKANEDFVATSGMLSRLLVFEEPGEADLGTIAVDIIGDDLTEGTENYKVVLTNATPEQCENRAALQTPEAEGKIVDAAQTPSTKPDLVISAVRLLPDCKIELTIGNLGPGTLPDQAYDPAHGAAIQMRRNTLPWGGIRLAGVDPTKKLKAPGTSVKHVWFPSAANLNLPVGLQTLSVQIDRSNVVAEANETNNTTAKKVFCKR